MMAPLGYLRRRTRRRATLLIAGAWASAFLWLLPVLAWKHIHPTTVQLHHSSTAPLLRPKNCETDFAHNIAFKLVTSALNFYLPSVLIVVLYYRIFKTIKRRTMAFPPFGDQETTIKTVTNSSEKESRKPSPSIQHSKCRILYGKDSEVSVETHLYKTLTVVGANRGDASSSCYRGVTVQVEYLDDRRHHHHHRTCYKSRLTCSTCRYKPDNASTHSRCNRINRSQSSPTFMHHASSGLCSCQTSSPTSCRKSGNQKLASDRKAARQLGVIMGVFLACWVPYFTIFPVIAFCSSCVPSSAHLATISLGYLNSALNPAIYPLCNQHFRRAFARMLRCRQ